MSISTAGEPAAARRADPVDRPARAACGQCLHRRIPERERLEREVAAWEAERNTLGGPVNWHVTTEDARVKPKRLYPSRDG